MLARCSFLHHFAKALEDLSTQSLISVQQMDSDFKSKYSSQLERIQQLLEEDEEEEEAEEEEAVEEGGK